MKMRFDYSPELYAAFSAIDKYLHGTDLKPIHKEIISNRCSQINGCAICLGKHTQLALKAGETAERIFLLDTWREADVFTAEERAILAMCEEITDVKLGGLTTATYDQAVELMGEDYVKVLIIAIININSWNRLMLSMRKPVE